MLKSKRLLTIAEMVPKNRKVFDVGCNHGLLSVYLYVHNHNTVVASDIVLASVEKTKQFVESQKCKIDVIQTNGLHGLPIAKEDVIVIAGMGTSTILSILKNDIALVSDYLVLASNNDHEQLRREMQIMGYCIVDERVVYENKKYYILIAYQKGNQVLTEEDILWGPIIRHKEKQYLLFLDNKYKVVQKKIPWSHFHKKYRLWNLQHKLKNNIKKIR